MSPIKGITEIVRLPRLDKIRLGIKQEGDNGRIYPVPTDYFVCPDEVRAVFGEKPRELRIMFPTENEEQWASQYLRCYSAWRGLVCRGDGETAVARVNIQTGEIDSGETASVRLKEISCNPVYCHYYQCDQCRRVMNLQFLLPDCPGFGVYQLDTSSIYSIKDINSAITFIRGICQRVSMIPLSLKLVEREVRPEGWVKTAHVLKLTCSYSLAEVQRFAQVPPGQALILPPPDSEAPDDLFPQELFKDTKTQVNTDSNEKLLELWTKTKSKIWHFDIQDFQIANWFEKNCHIKVRLKDFESLYPPSQITAENLTRFCQAIDQYTGR